jgi:hypothetical protein
MKRIKFSNSNFRKFEIILPLFFIMLSTSLLFQNCGRNKLEVTNDLKFNIDTPLIASPPTPTSTALPVQRSSITAAQVGMLDFRYAQTPNLTDQEMNGLVDVTAKLNAAITTSRFANKSLFISTGTYLVSDTIDCVLEHSGSGQILNTTNIIGSAIQHPVIKLADNTTAFKGTLPKAVFHYRSSTGLSTDWMMRGGIRGIDIDLGIGNTMAVGLYWGCAQYCYIEDINIKANDAFAGLTGIGGANSLLANITVNGGKHGLYLPDGNEAATWGMLDSPQNTITGCTFINQTDIPIVLWGWGGITLVGVSIVKNAGVAILLNSYSTYVETSPLSIIDSKIEFTNVQSTNTFIQNLNKATVSLRGVYIKGAGTITNNNNDENLNAPSAISGWNHIVRYNYVTKTQKEGYSATHYDALTGLLYSSSVVLSDSLTPPIDLTSKHIWPTTPSFEDPDSFLVTDVNQLQNAIDNNSKVVVASGTYKLTAPITLKANTVLLGCPGIGGPTGAIFEYGFIPTQQTWLINTVDDSEATTYIMDITTNPGTADYLGSLHWMAGRNSIIRTVRFDKSWDDYEKNLIRLYFSNNGGGRVFNYQDEKAMSGLTTDPNNSLNHRKVKISGTSQLLTFYGLNLERGGNYNGESSFPLVEITNSSNIRIFGAKSETYQPYAKIDNSTNIFMTNIHDFANINSGLTKQNFIEITGALSDNIEISNAMFIKPPNSSYLIVSDPWNTNEPQRTMTMGLYRRHWTTFF